MNTQSAFALSGAMSGVRRIMPLALGDAVFSIVWGALARQAGLTFVESMMINGLVFAGAAQLVALGLWTTPPPALPIILATAVVNLRHLLMGAALHPWFSQLPSYMKYGTAFFMTDETWALTVGEFREGRRNGAFMIGSGLTQWTAGSIGTGVGYTFGALVQNPQRWGLDFMFVGLFVALIVGLWKGKSDVIPWMVAALVAVLVAVLLPGRWYILAGCLTGSIVGVLRDVS